MLENETEINKLCEQHLIAPNTMQYNFVLANIQALVDRYLQNNFMALVQLLYRVDVSEKRITDIAENKILDANIIATLILDRILEKLRHKKENTLPKQDDATNEVDKW